MKKIITTTSSFGKSDDTPLNLLRSAGCDVLANPHGRTLTEAEAEAFYSEERPVGVVAGVEPITADLLGKVASHLKVISRCGTGMDNVDLAAAERLDIKVLNTPEAPAEAVAELTIGFIFSLLRNIPAHNEAVQSGQWKKQMGRLISETTIGVMGLGRIGRRVATFLDALGAHVVAADVKPSHEWLAAHPRVTLVEASELLAAADVLTLHLPSASGDLHHFMNKDRLARMKPGSFLVNTSRGALVDENALIAALESGHMAGAAIDVFENEPYQGGLLGRPSVILSPHAGSYARATRVRMETEAAQNLIVALQELCS